MIRFTKLQRPLRGDPIRASNRMLGSPCRRASFVAHAALAIASTSALLLSAAPSWAADIVVTRKPFEGGWQNSGVINGNITFTATSGGFGTIKNSGTINGTITANSGGQLENLGVVTGNIIMPTGNILNLSGGVINSGSTIEVSANGFYNHGVLSPGGDGNVQTTSISNYYSQSSTGSYVTTLASPTSADKLEVADDARVHGKVVVNRTGVIGDTGSVTIMSSNGTLTNNISSVTQNGWQYAVNRVAGSSGTTYYRYDYTNCCGNYVLATTSTPGDGTNYSTNLYVSDGMGGYTITGLTLLPTAADQLVLSWNRMSLASYANSVSLTSLQSNVVSILAGAEAGNAKIRKVNDSLLDSTVATVQSSINALTPTAYVADLNSWWQANNAFMQSVNSCPKLEGSPGLIVEGQCYWTKFGGRHSDWNTTATNIGGQDQGYSFSGGVQVALRDEWRLGFAGSYETATIDTANGASTDRDSFEGAVVLKNRWGNFSAAAAGFAGYGWADTERTLFGGLAPAKSDREMWLAGTNLRLSHLFDLPHRWYVKPMVDLNATHIATKDFSERGGGGANLAVEGDGTWVLSASPALEVGTEIRSGGILYRPFVRVGGTFLDDATFDVTASFLAAPGQLFTTSQSFDDTYFDVSAGIDILTADGVDLKLTYDGRFAEDSTSLALGAKASIPF
ncbi:autotransporter outer membrane beta-barrel domain-containing protein [Hyphomicrobium sp.]|uniref:autotransporter family protein n=1 Tax=Hyphomicrobium sp. TaxID=82 RepID=UPI003F6FD0F8